jgi:hypothetical protein
MTACAGTRFGNHTLLIFYVCVCGTNLVVAEAFVDAEAGLVYNDNWSRAERSRDIEDDVAAEANVSLGYFYQPGSNAGYTVASSLSAALFERNDDLNNTRFNFSGRWSQKLGLGRDAARVGAGMQAGYQAFQNDVRDAWLYSIDGRFVQPINEQVQLTLLLAYELTDGDTDTTASNAGPGPGPGGGGTADGDSFDTESWQTTVMLSYDLTEQWALSASYRFRTGEITSTATPSDDIVAAATAITRDNSFGSGRSAYRLDADSHAINVGGSYALDDSTSLTMSYEHQATDGDEGIDYSNNILRMGVLAAF